MFQKGFSLIELLLSLAIISIIVMITIPIYGSFQARNDLTIAATTVAQTLRRAQILSQAVSGDSGWGVKIQTGSITLFKGAGYAGRDAGFDEIFAMPGNITPGGITEIVFNKFSGEPLAGGIITLTSVNNEIKNIAINGKGMVSY